jgi:hypothetical protein
MNPEAKKADFTTDVVTLSGTPGDWFVTVNDSSSGTTSEHKLDIADTQEEVISQLQDYYPFSRVIFKQAMIMSDAELETKPVSSGEAPKDDIAENSHPATPEGGAPVLDGEVHHPERPNVNAMREVIETQAEMEVGKTVEETQAEVKAEEVGDNQITVDKGSGRTQIIINITGKQRTVTFSNVATANAFIKGASAKFGDKFKVIAAPAIGGENQPITSGKSDIDDAAPNFKSAFREPDERYLPQTSPRSGVYNIMVGDQFVFVAPDETYRIVPDESKATRFDGDFGAEDAKQIAAEIKESEMAMGNPVRVVPAKKTGANMKSAGFSFAPPQIGSQVLVQFYPEVMHELTEYPNASNSPMPVEMTGDPHVGQGQEEAELLPGAIEDAFSGMNRIGYVSTSPAGGMGIGRDGKSQVLEGAPLRKETDIRGPMFTDEFYQNYDAVPGAAFASLREKKAGAEEKKQFGLFLKKVMGEVAATFIAAFKVTTRMPMNQIPGVGEIQLAQVEQPIASTFNIVNTGSRVKYLMDKLTDSEIQDAINDAFAQGAVWHEAKEGGFVYEVFVRAETIDTESMILKYKFVTGTKEAE